MCVCSFLGHDEIYDNEVFENIQRAVNGLCGERDGVEFLFFRGGRYGAMCLCAALRAKRRYPDKKISVSLVVKEEERERVLRALKWGRSGFPACAVDRVISPPRISVPENSRDFSLAGKKITRWILRQSTHLVCYLYPEFFEAENQLRRYAENRNVGIIDVTDEGTKRFIKKSIRGMTEKKRAVIKRLMAGDTQKETGAAFGITASAAAETARQAGRSLREAARVRLRETENGEGAPSCSIFTLGSATPYKLAVFEQTVRFLRRELGVTQFNIQQEHSHSKYSELLSEIAESCGDIHITVMTHYPERSKMTREEWEWAVGTFSSGGCTVENIDTHAVTYRAQVMRAVKMMIDHSDFCICSLASNPIADSIRTRAERRGGKTMFDISKKYTGAD